MIVGPQRKPFGFEGAGNALPQTLSRFGSIEVTCIERRRLRIGHVRGRNVPNVLESFVADAHETTSNFVLGRQVLSSNVPDKPPHLIDNTRILALPLASVNCNSLFLVEL